jgi:hypothetical protein
MLAGADILRHANVQARRIITTVFLSQMGRPEFNYHADDIDFQIKPIIYRFMCPANGQAFEICDKIGHIMNYGDGVYGGFCCRTLFRGILENNISILLKMP